MRTTISLDEDVIDSAKVLVKKSGKPFRVIVNQALRLGLTQVGKPFAKRPYTTHPHKLGLRRGLSLDNVQELLAEVEGEKSR